MAPSYEVLLGPILVGSLLAYLLIGAYTVQLFHYLTGDFVGIAWIQLHILVGIETVLQVTNVVFITQNTWRGLVSSVAQPDLRYTPPSTSPGTPILTGLSSCLVQCFFAWRIVVLGRRALPWVRYTVAGLIVAFALFQMTAAFVIGAKYVRYQGHPDLIEQLQLSIWLHLSGNLASDTLITISMIYVLWDFKVSKELSPTKRILNSLIFHSVENMAVTTVFTVFNLAFYVARPQDTIHLSFQYTVGRLYANALLANLNGRARPGKELERDGSPGEAGLTFRDIGNKSRATFSTDSNPRSALYGLTAPKMHARPEGNDGPGDGIFRLGKKRPDVRVKSPPPAFLVSTVTEVHRDEDIVSRATSRYSGVQSRPQSGDSSSMGY